MQSHPRSTRGATLRRVVPKKRTLPSESGDEEDESFNHLTEQPVTPDHPEDSKPPDYSVSVDVGTTQTCVAVHKRGMPTDRILTIDDFPGEQDLSLSNRQISTELWYPNRSKPLNDEVEEDDIRLRFGHEVPRMAAKRDGVELSEFYEKECRVSMMKLQLDQTDYAQTAKSRLIDTLDHLQDLGYISKRTDVFADFLCLLLGVVKDRLQRDMGMQEDNSVQLIFSVPVCWTPSAIQIMSSAFEFAMKEVRLGTDGTEPCNMFILHEAEAQGMHALTQPGNGLETDEVFIYMDCGGGTIDVGVYRIAIAEPLRLGSEVIKADGAMVGATNVNEAFREFMKRLLLGDAKRTPAEIAQIEDIIDVDLLPDFENKYKRAFVSPDNKDTYVFRLRGLKPGSKDKRLKRDAIQLSGQDMWEIFEPTITAICEMLEKAVIGVLDLNEIVHKFVLGGGFGDSPCLRKRLREEVQKLNAKYGLSLEVCYAPRNMSATGVATGGILRGLDKEHGPARIPRLSIGILRHIPKEGGEEEYADAVLEQGGKYCAAEGVEYIYNTLKYIVKLGTQPLPPVHRVSFVTEHIFPSSRKLWIIEEEIFASSTSSEDHFQLTHTKNEDTLRIMVVEFDITAMKKQIQNYHRLNRQKVNKVQVLVEMTVIDRQLGFTARWPPIPTGQVFQGSRKFTNVASAFTPGTQ